MAIDPKEAGREVWDPVHYLRISASPVLTAARLQAISARARKDAAEFMDMKDKESVRFSAMLKAFMQTFVDADLKIPPGDRVNIVVTGLIELLGTALTDEKAMGTSEQRRRVYRGITDRIEAIIVEELE